MDKMTAQALSARDTFFMKFIFPTIWIAGFGVATVAVFRNHVLGTGPGPWGLPERWGFLVLWVTISLFLAWGCGQVLCISDYVREIRVPLADVTTVFGQKIVFIPRGPLPWFWKPHPVAEELRSLVSRAGGAPTVPTAG